MQEGGSGMFSADKKKELTTRQFVRKINEAELFITAKEETVGEMELMIGSYKEIVNSRGVPMFMPMGGGTVSFYMAFTPGFSTSWSKTTYMKMILDKNTFSHINRSLPQSIQEKRESFEKVVPEDISKSEFRTHDKEYLFIFDYNTKKFQTIEFTR